MDIKNLLWREIKYNGGNFIELWENEFTPEKTTFTASVTTREGYEFKFTGKLQKDQPLEHLRQQVYSDLVGFILQKAFEFANEQVDIHKMFDPTT